MTATSATRAVFGALVAAMALGAQSAGRAAGEPGVRVYENHCQQCHGPEGRGRGTVAPSLVPFRWSFEEALELIRRPMCDMPPIPESALSDADVAQIVAYLKAIR